MAARWWSRRTGPASGGGTSADSSPRHQGHSATAVQSGELGRLEYVYSNRLSMGKIRQEENALWSFAPHDISMILRLTGQMPMEVSGGGRHLPAAQYRRCHRIESAVRAAASRAHIFVSWLHPYKEQRLVMIGSKKMVVFEDSTRHRQADDLRQGDRLEERTVRSDAAQGHAVPFPSG